MDRPGWLDAPRASLAEWDALVRFAAEVRRDGLRRVVVCGMGGSSLAPAVIAASVGHTGLVVLDSTDPAAVRAVERGGALAETLFLIASKSGTTVETLAAYRYFAARAAREQFAAITDPGTPLEALGRERGFRAVFRHPPDIGGRYAALTVVGMLPAALTGVDGRALLERALGLDVGAARALGARLARAALAGRDKLRLQPPAPLARLADWIEQLVAESSGKDGRGIIPVVDDPVSAPRADAETVAEFSNRPLDLGLEFLRWEYATWELCGRLGVNAFDQPDVEAAKALARAELSAPSASRAVPLPTLAPEALRRAARPGDYLAILAYLPPDADVTRQLGAVRAAWARSLGLASTVGLGPRYLHSTGQLHKGGPNTGLFLVITAETGDDIAIPEMGLTFGQLELAQARGDIRALLARGRRVAHVHLERPEQVREFALL